MSIFFPKAAAPAPLEQVATQGGEPTVVSRQLHHHGHGKHAQFQHGQKLHAHRHHMVRVFIIAFLFGHWMSMGEVLFDFGSAATNIGNICTIMKSCEFTFLGVILRQEGQIKRKFLWLAVACWLANSLWLQFQVWEWRRCTHWRVFNYKSTKVPRSQSSLIGMHGMCCDIGASVVP